MNEASDVGMDINVADSCLWIMKSRLPDIEKFLIILLLRNGLRVSEICNTSNIRIIDKYKVYVWCTKNNTWRQCVTGEASELLGTGQVEADLTLWKRNRQYYYRVLKGLLPQVESMRVHNEPVTHAARNIVAQQVCDATESMQATRISIGNSSNRATARYINREQRKAYQKDGLKGNISGTVSSINATVRGVLRRKS